MAPSLGFSRGVLTSACFVGIDGGGSRTRVAVVDGGGHLRGFAESGGCNPEWLPQEACRDHLLGAVRDAFADVGHERRAVRGVVAAIAGVQRPEDGRWVRDALASVGWTSAVTCVNDRVAAQRGALLGDPGVVAIAGTGMVTSAVTETGREVLTWQLGSGGAPGAVALVRQFLARVGAEEDGADDAPLVEAMFVSLGVGDRAALREALWQGKARPSELAALAPLVTAAAERGVPLAGAVCADAVQMAVRGIRLVGYCVRSERIPVVLIGGVIRSGVMRRGIEAGLTVPGSRLELREPVLPPVGGAAVLCLEGLVGPVRSDVAERLGAELAARCPA